MGVHRNDLMGISGIKQGGHTVCNGKKKGKYIYINRMQYASIYGIHMYTFTYIMYIYIYIYVCVYACKYKYIYISFYMHICKYTYIDISFYHDILASKKPTQHDMSKKYGIPANSPLNRQNEHQIVGHPIFKQTPLGKLTSTEFGIEITIYLVWGSKVFL